MTFFVGLNILFVSELIIFFLFPGWIFPVLYDDDDNDDDDNEKKKQVSTRNGVWSLAVSSSKRSVDWNRHFCCISMSRYLFWFWLIFLFHFLSVCERVCACVCVCVCVCYWPQFFLHTIYHPLKLPQTQFNPQLLLLPLQLLPHCVNLVSIFQVDLFFYIHIQFNLLHHVKNSTSFSPSPPPSPFHLQYSFYFIFCVTLCPHLLLLLLLKLLLLVRLLPTSSSLELIRKIEKKLLL